MPLTFSDNFHPVSMAPREHSLAVGLVVLILAVVYALTIPWLRQLMGESARLFAFFYLFLGAWYWGMSRGALLALVNAIIMTLVYSYQGTALDSDVFGSIFSIFISAFVGRISDLTRQLKWEVGEHHRARAELADHRNSLERTVLERTASLREARNALEGELEERKQVEAQLAQSRDQLRTITGNLPTSVIFQYVSSPDGKRRFSHISENVLQFNGVTAQQVMENADVLHNQVLPESRAALEKAIERSIDSMEPLRREILSRMPDGSVRWFELAMTPMEQDGGLVAWNGVQVDITDRKKAELALTESERRYRDLVESSPDGIFVANGSGNYVDVNRTASELTGYSREELLAMKLTSLIAPEHQEKTWADFQRLQKSGRIAEDYLFVRKDGSRFQLALDAVKLSQDRYLAFCKDITDRVRMEKEREEARALLRAAVEQSPSGVIVVDAPGAVVRIANSAALEILGAGAGDLLDVDVSRYAVTWESLRPDRSPYPAEDLPLSHAVGTGKITRGEEIIVRQESGKETWVSVNAAPILDSEGQITGGIVIFHDITEKKLASQERIQLEARLRQSQKMEAIGTLAGGIAHDFNNILGAIMGFSELALLNSRQGEPIEENLRSVLQGCRRAADLVKQILTFSRQTERRLLPLDMAPVVKEALKLLRSTLPASIEIRQDIDTGGRLILADATQIHQVVMNLCANAASAMDTEKGVLSVDLNVRDLDREDGLDRFDLSPGPYIHLAVSDTGRGMEPELLDKIFEPYFTTRETGKGTGLGLAVVHGIIKGHGGGITVYSEPGQGSVFHAYFPIVQAPELVQDFPLGAPALGGTENILFVDDEESLTQSGSHLLQTLGYQVTTANSSGEALEIFNRAPQGFDLVITDMTMPEMDGMELADAVHRIRPGLPFILCTGFSRRISRERLSRHQINKLVMKPIVRGEMARAIREVLD